tara:strand:- start:415 stop:1095 length:681 start_codon:yes stop_codon:yes gene_type:complete
MDIDAIIESNGNLYQTWFPDEDIKLSYRLLSIQEYKVFRGLRASGVLTEWELFDVIFERCYLGNAYLISENISAGITITVGQLILYLSGDCDQETLREDIMSVRMQHPADTVFEYMRSVIMTVFPYKIEEMESWPRPKFLRNFTIAENVLCKQNPEYERLDLKQIKTAEEVAEENKKKSSGHGIDFAADNRAVKKAMGPFDIEEAEQGKLSRGQLKKLSQVKNRTR